MMITSWQISHTNCLETLSDWINKQVSAASSSSQLYSLVQTVQRPHLISATVN